MRCPICNHKSNLLFKRQNQLASVRMVTSDKKELSVAGCKNCNFIWNYNAFKKPKKFNKWIASAYKNYQLLDNTLHHFPLIDERAKLAKNFIEENCDFETIHHIIEVGSNRGDFLAYLQQNYPEKNYLGVESSALSKVGIPTIFNNIMDLNFSSSYDLVIIRQVLEHITQPEKFLNHLQSFLKKDGYICIEVPDIVNDLRENIEPWIIEHVACYSKASLTTLCEKVGLKVIACNQEEQLLLLLQKTPHTIQNQAPIYNNELFEIIENFNNNIHTTQKEWLEDYQNDYELCFYGASNVFLTISGILEHLWNNKWTEGNNKTLLDDYTHKKGSIINNLPVETLDSFKPSKKCIYIICAMNRDHHHNMLKKLKEKCSSTDKIYIMWTKVND